VIDPSAIKAWGNLSYGGTGAPSTGVYTKIYSTAHAFAALKADGPIKAWGNLSYGGATPSGSGGVDTIRGCTCVSIT
jgi:hypothetical protein